MLSADDLACRRGERLVFAGLSFALGPGEALVLRGPNGSGKSSLLRLLAGLLRREAGSLRWQGQDVDADREAWRAAFAFAGHADGIKPPLTVRENVAFWAEMAGSGTDRVAEALERFAITPLAEVPVRFLSAGQKRRTGLARLVAAPRTIWLLDEPSVGLDAAATTSLAALMAEHRAGGGMIIAAT
ncbi:MAG: heme ABC exporter ATP-binding protein CcmA, partial [Alphaproteobacteria bacterium]|nr:heme ABC exporter ATP-binding protein CcmA [Alphaproteobacteria bacterium]